ncbi:polyketide synthase dehydratase domain-containing protein, partial [Streptomyces mirabilis]|uniref:polyketide synthase dehydratase domain-containing protein n=1 Tax=Streptomyces mirabilis TaxID=68239 RepID=UPI0036C86B4C
HTTVDWAGFYPATHPTALDLPTYPFQRERYWIRPTTGTDPEAVGLQAADHGLFGAAVALAEGEGHLFTGRLSLRDQTWLSDHAVHDTLLLPGTAFVELALHAGEATDASHVEDLAIEAPLILPATGGLHLQVHVAAADQDGRRDLTIHSRPSDAASDAPWSRHATGVLTSQVSAVPDWAEWAESAAWPPAGATSLPVADLYDHLADLGYRYGPAFQGLTAAWRHGDSDTLYAEVSLPADLADADRYGIHPALFDAALHPIAVTGAEEVLLPFAWSDVRIHAVGARSLRVRIIRSDAGTLRVQLADPDGRPVAEVASLAVRPLPPGQLTPAPGTDDRLFRVAWTATSGVDDLEVGRVAFLGPDVAGELLTALPGDVAIATYPDLAALLADDTAVPDLVIATGLLDLSDSAGDVPGATRAAVQYALDLLQAWLAEERLTGSRLVFLTKRAVSVDPATESPALAGAAAWGLLRTAQSENPDRLTLIDLDDASASLGAALASGEPQIALRDGDGQWLYVPRLVRATRRDGDTGGPEPVEGGTVLITGGTGTLGGLLARHYAGAGRVGHVVLVSRRGS